jgi:sulfide:quinone oxidoreductase
MSRITVIGAGFGALTAIRKLRAADASLQIDVIAPKPEFVYFPGTIWLPTGLRKPEDLVVPLHNFFRRMKVTYHKAEATGLRDGGRTLETSTGDIVNDGLIIASGGRFLRKLPGIEHSITPCGGIAAGGPMFEFLFGIDNWLKKQGRRDKFKLVFFSPAPKPGVRL